MLSYLKLDAFVGYDGYGRGQSVAGIDLIRDIGDGTACKGLCNSLQRRLCHDRGVILQLQRNYRRARLDTQYRTVIIRLEYIQIRGSYITAFS